MLIFFVLLILVFSLFVLIYLFSPEKLPWYRPHLILDKSEMELVKAEPINRQPLVMEGLVQPEGDFNVSLEENISRLENILSEKNKTIEKLQKELAAEKRHRNEFEKVKAILDEEINSLRNQNKQLKNRLPLGDMQRAEEGLSSRGESHA